MNASDDSFHQSELEFADETIKRNLATNPNSALAIALQLLTRMKVQRQQKYDLEQKYNELLTSYLNVNDAYLAALRRLRDRECVTKAN